MCLEGVQPVAERERRTERALERLAPGISSVGGHPSVAILALSFPASLIHPGAGILSRMIHPLEVTRAIFGAHPDHGGAGDGAQEG